MADRNENPAGVERRVGERRRSERRRGTLLHFPASSSTAVPVDKTINLWRTVLYFVILAVVLAAVAYWLVHPK